MADHLTPMLAHGTQGPPTGGASGEELLMAAVLMGTSLVAVVLLGWAQRRKGVLNPLVRWVERTFGLPGWSLIPTSVAGGSLVIAVWGYYWDVSWHIDRGRDEGAFANPAHWFIAVGLMGIALAGILSAILGDDRSPSALRFGRNKTWAIPAGGVLLGACGVVALLGFPLDDLWHRLFGQDVTAWGPTHVQMIGGASLSTLGCWALLAEGRRATNAALPRRGAVTVRLADLALAGAFLIGLSTLQVEFDYGVPQFRILEHPILIALAAGIALVAARVHLGRGGALGAVAFFLAVRIGLAIGVDAVGRTQFHLPLYLGAALVVEAVALAVPTRRQVTFGALAGLGAGTLGVLIEAFWIRAHMPIPWTSDLLPDAAIACAVAGTAGGVLGGLIGRALAVAGPGEPEPARQPTPRFAAGLAWLGVVVTIGWALPLTATNITADLTFEPAEGPVRAGDPEQAFVTIDLGDDGVDAAAGASWFQIVWWQGADQTADGGSDRIDLVRTGDRTFRSAEPVPVSGQGKSMVLLQDRRSLQALPLHLPEDLAIPVDEVAATDGTRSFQAAKTVLQREAKTDAGTLELIAYAVLAGIGALWMVVISWGLRRIERAGAPPSTGAPTAGAARTARPPRRTTPVPTGA